MTPWLLLLLDALLRLLLLRVLDQWLAEAHDKVLLDIKQPQQLLIAHDFTRLIGMLHKHLPQKLNRQLPHLNALLPQALKPDLQKIEVLVDLS